MMKDEDMQFDRTCHVLYSKPCKKQIQAKIALHYPVTEREMVWEQIQRQYVTYLSDWRTDLGGSKNFHNGTGGTYDCIALMSYYTVCKTVTTVGEIEKMENELFLPMFRMLSFADCNKLFWKRILHWSFAVSEKKCIAWHDYEMSVAPYDKNTPIYYEFTACPIAEFAKKHDLLEVMPAMCNPDYAAMELLHARLVRTTTCADGCKCDYPPEIQAEYYRSQHKEVAKEKLNKLMFLKKLNAVVVFLFVFAWMLHFAGAKTFWQGVGLTWVYMLSVFVWDTFFLDWVLFANIKRLRLPGTEHMETEYHQKWFHVKVCLPVVPFAILAGFLSSGLMLWIW